MADTISPPVHDVLGDPPKEGPALCLSGGGYRAMLFHLGCLWRLNEAGLLGSLKRISSVSGGSITAAVLGLNWTKLGFTPANPRTSVENLKQFVIAPIRQMASITIDEGAVLGGIFLPGSIADHIADHYDSTLFHGATLQNLPDDASGPRFVINATSVQSGVLMRFSKPFMRDYRVGKWANPTLPLALAVAASSAFPPILSPCEINLKKYGGTLTPAGGEDLTGSEYTDKVVLSDGGVYDNLGLETAWKQYKTLLVSDGGGHFAPEPDPHHDWARHSYRVLNLIDSQVRALRTRTLIGLFDAKVREGCYWGIRGDIRVYEAPNTLPCPLDKTTALAAIDTRLKKLDNSVQERLINWGYAICDASLRKNFQAALPKPDGFPYPDVAV